MADSDSDDSGPKLKKIQPPTKMQQVGREMNALFEIHQVTNQEALTIVLTHTVALAKRLGIPKNILLETVGQTWHK